MPDGQHLSLIHILLIEKYIGKTGRKLFLLFCWLFCGIVIAAFADMVAGTFNAYGADGALVEAAQTNGAAGMVSIMFMVFAVVFGLLQKNLHFTGWKENVISIVFIVLSFVVGANFPIILGKAAWSYITFVYIFFAAVLPMWLLKQPRDHMTTFMFVAMIVGAVLGLIVNHPVMNLPVFTGFTLSLIHISAGWQTSGASTPLPRPRQLSMRTAGTTFPPTAGPCLHTLSLIHI